MYAFKVMTTTLITILMFTMLYVGLKSKDSTKYVIAMMIIIEAMGIISIWG